MQGGQRQPSAQILIIEDNELNLKLLNDLLEYHGYEVLCAENGVAAIDLARRHRPDLILLDIRLPDIPGTEVVRQLKADTATSAIPVIAVTAFAMPGDRTKTLEAGCDDYISKPYNVRDLLELVERYIGLAEQH